MEELFVDRCWALVEGGKFDRTQSHDTGPGTERLEGEEAEAGEERM